MKKTIARAAAVAALSGLALAGCGLTTEEKEPVAAPTIEAESPVEEEEAPAVETEKDAEAKEQSDEAKAKAKEKSDKAKALAVAGPGVYQAPIGEGGIATVAVPGTGPEDIEQFRKDAGADPVGYLVVEVDNTEGTEEAMVFEAEIVDSEGKTYTYEEVMSGMSDWSGDNFDLLERELELWEKYPYSTRPSAKNTVPLIGPEVPEDIVSVFIDYEQAERVGDL